MQTEGSITDTSWVVKCYKWYTDILWPLRKWYKDLQMLQFSTVLNALLIWFYYAINIFLLI